VLWLALALVLPGIIILTATKAMKLDLASATLTVGLTLPLKAIAAAFVLLATWLASRLQQRPLATYGIPPQEALGRLFWEGTVWGFGMLSLLLLPLWAMGHFHIESVALRGSELLVYALGWGLVFLCVSVNEELMFRGYLLYITARRTRFWWAAIFLSIGFGVAHLGNPGETVVGILQVVGTGLLFCFMIRRTGNLWFVLGFHAAWDWAQTFFYGTPDSGLKSVGYFLNSSISGPPWLTGGSTGPEGSIFSVVILVICAVLIHRRFPTAIYPDRPA
jgi:membrane protease YdiL (CAAX protease family)